MTARYGYGRYGEDIYAVVDPFSKTQYNILIDWDADGHWSNEVVRLLEFRVERGRSSIVPPSYSISIDWDRDGSFTEENSRIQDFRVERGRSTLVQGTMGYTSVDPGFFSLLLDDYDQRYNPFNTASPIYGYIKPNRPFRLQATDTDGNDYDVITGWVRRIIPQPGSKQVRIEGYDGIDWLAAQACSRNTIQTNYAISQAIVDLINATGWPFADTSGWILDTSELGTGTILGSSAVENNGDTMPYWWMDPDISVWSALTELAEAYAGDVFVANNGVFSYNARNYGETPSLYLTQDQVGKDIELQFPWDEIRNDIKINAYPRLASAANTELWKLQDVVQILPSESLTLYARFTYEGNTVPALSVETPVVTTDFIDYTANATSDGAGADLTSDLSVTLTTYASQAYLLLENTGGNALYVTLLKLRGVALYTNSGLTAEETDTDNQSEYGKSSFSIDNRWIQQYLVAQYHAGHAKSLLTSERKIPKILIFERPSLQLAVDLFDVVNLDFPGIAVTGNHYVTRIAHTWTNKQGIITELRLEPTADNAGQVWILDNSELGTETVLGW